MTATQDETELDVEWLLKLRVVVANTTAGTGTMLCDPATSQPPTACP